MTEWVSDPHFLTISFFFFGGIWQNRCHRNRCSKGRMILNDGWIASWNHKYNKIITFACPSPLLDFYVTLGITDTNTHTFTFTKGLWSLRLQIADINDWTAYHATGQILGMHSGASRCPAWHRHQQRWLAHKGNLSRAPIMTICHSPESIEMTNEEQKPCWQVECVALNHTSHGHWVCTASENRIACKVV